MACEWLRGGRQWGGSGGGGDAFAAALQRRDAAPACAQLPTRLGGRVSEGR